MLIRTQLIDRCEAFCAKHDFTEWRFGRDAVSDHRFLTKLRQGSGVTLTTIERAEEFMRDTDAQAA